MASPMAAARTEDDAKRLFDERVNWQIGQFPRSALAEVEVRGLNSRRKQEPGTETLLLSQVVLGVPFYNERDNVVSQLVTLRQVFNERKQKVR